MIPKTTCTLHLINYADLNPWVLSHSILFHQIKNKNFSFVKRNYFIVSLAFTMKSLSKIIMELPMTRWNGMVLAILLSLATALVFYPVAAQNIQDATVWLNKGKEAFQKKDYVSAIAAYDQALNLDQYYTEGWKLRGDVMMELNRYAEAAESYDRAIAIDKTNADLFGKKGRAIYKLGNYQEALEILTRAVSLNPNSFQNKDFYGDVLAALNRFTEADNAYTGALKIDPKNNETWNKKGEVLAKMYRNEEAISAFNQSIQIYPDSAKVWNNIGGVHFAMGNLNKALTAFEKAIFLDESYIPQKYGDTISRLAKADSSKQNPKIEENVEIPVANISFEIPPSIFLLNYIMIIIGIIVITLLGAMGVMRKRTSK